MDKYNCISIVGNLNDLDNEYDQWNQLTYDMKKKSNDDCIRQFGMTNEELYNYIKAKLLSNVKENYTLDTAKLEQSILEYKNSTESILNEYTLGELFKMDKTAKLYHGSPNPNLKELKPFTSFGRTGFIFATPDYNLALSYAGKQWKIAGIDNALISKNGWGKYGEFTVDLRELKPDALKIAYDHPGYIYEIDPRDRDKFHFPAFLKGVDERNLGYAPASFAEMISVEPVRVCNRIKIPNVLKALQDRNVSLTPFHKRNLKWYGGTNPFTASKIDINQYEDLKALQNIHESIEADISNLWFVKSDDGANNACINVKGYNRPFRARSSMLIIDQDSVFLKKNKDGSYSAPGGGWEPNETPERAAIREAQEEARINVKNVLKCGTLIEYSPVVQDWVKNHVHDSSKWWYGYYSVIFVGQYDSRYNGNIKDIDKDDMLTKGQWYPISEVIDKLNKEYAEAIKFYLNHKNNSSAINEADFVIDNEIKDQIKSPSTVYKTNRISIQKYEDDKHLMERLNKIKRAIEIMTNDDDLVIINDFIDDNYPDYDRRILDDQLNKWSSLNQEHQRRSDGWNLHIWGRTVLDMYNYMRSKLDRKDFDTHNDVKSPQIRISDTDANLLRFKDEMELDVGHKDYMSLITKKIDCIAPSENRSLYEAAVLEGFYNKIQIRGKTYRQSMPEITPFLTYNEYVNNPRGLFSHLLDRVDPFTYVMNYMDKNNKPLDDIREAYRLGNEEELVRLGWNPRVKPTAENFKFARDRQIRWFEENYPIDILDLSEYTTNLDDSELFEAKDLIDQKVPNLEPIYMIIQQGTVTNLTQLSWLSRDYFVYPGISFDSSMREIYYFEDRSKNWMDYLYCESIDDYCAAKGTPDIYIIVAFVMPEVKKRLKAAVGRYYTAHSTSIYRQDATDIKKDSPKEFAYNMEFMIGKTLNTFFLISGINFKFNKNIPKYPTYGHFPNRYNFFTIFHGKYTYYNFRETDRKVKAMQNMNNYYSLTMFKPQFAPDRIRIKALENFLFKTGDERIDTLLEYARDAFTPKSVFEEVPKDFNMGDYIDNYVIDKRKLDTSSAEDISGIKDAVKRLYGLETDLTKRLDEITQEDSEFEAIQELYNKIEDTCNYYSKVIKLAEGGKQ